MAKTNKIFNVPNLRFPGFDGEWEERKFNSIYSFKKTNSYSRENLNYEKGEIKNIHYGDIHTRFNSLFDVDVEVVPFINKEIDTKFIDEDNYLKVGDLVIADASEDYNDIGKTIEIKNLNQEKLVAGLHTFLARKESKEIVNGFASFLMKTYALRIQIMKIAQGTKVLGISKGRLEKIKLTFPEIEEQYKLVDFLTLIDARIQTQNKIIHHLQSLIKGFSQKLFSQQIRFKDDNGNDFPEWEEKKLEEICSFFSGGTPKSTNKKYYNGHIPFIGSGNISDSEVISFITDEALNSSSAKLVEAGDLLYALYGATSGEVAISKINGAINQAVLCIRTNQNKQFIFQFLKLYKQRIIKTYIQGGQGNLSAKIIKELKIQLPSKEEQTKLANFLSSLDAKLEKEKQLLEQYQQQKKFLLQNLFV
ncbi:MAG: restriction endonuclease subunit S [Xanthomarina gelatinilytica]|uniref:restriction endonuclease subunit S n=1 Tax=Xanthomarina gelatinilytica TaxID=1137281 RepID=UPI003A871E2B